MIQRPVTLHGRRGLLRSLLAAPAIVAYPSLMRVSTPTKDAGWFYYIDWYNCKMVFRPENPTFKPYEVFSWVHHDVIETSLLTNWLDHPKVREKSSGGNQFTTLPATDVTVRLA